eukprot:CAMPEP_0179982568 /NCGR_PEP_ID=MMETSP0984-20121128/17_1 /TAXON_ID=483367 /ORGANISM="non described non described, Strain CCMP 2436" /LENGTH=100 /DNA_ID=CAMNT_0021900793 /DNA_START=316 /DNA_END=614 /DNA_ORIENTATION=+
MDLIVDETSAQVQLARRRGDKAGLGQPDLKRWCRAAAKSQAVELLAIVFFHECPESAGRVTELIELFDDALLEPLSIHDAHDERALCKDHRKARVIRIAV